jgi:hypothetical protein
LKEWLFRCGHLRHILKIFKENCPLKENNKQYLLLVITFEISTGNWNLKKCIWHCDGDDVLIFKYFSDDSSGYVNKHIILLWMEIHTHICRIGIILWSNIFFSFLVVLEFELRALYLLGRSSTTWVKSPLSFSYFQRRSHFYAHASPDHSPPIYTSHIVGMTGNIPRHSAFY